MDAEGRIEVPVEKPGLGVAVDRDFVENLTVRRDELRG
jgi:L-alanine-DL-glutamate epimerase-like enolase superfamily enzyme